MTDAYDTKFKQELIKGLTDKGLAPSSIKLYTRNLEKLNGDEPLKNLNFLKDPTAIQERLGKYRENTKRGYLISICSVLSLDKKTKPKQKLYDEYFKLMMDKNTELKGEEKENVKSETQEKNWMDWKDVEAKHKELEEKVNVFKDKKEINEHQYDTLLQLVVLSLYVLLAPRRNEYQYMSVVNTIPANGTDNYLDVAKKQMVFNRFKTSKKEGSITIDVPEQLQQVISTYLKFHPLIKGKIKKLQPTPFLVYHSGEPLDKVNSITRILNKIFGKKVGSSMLRHSYLSGKYGEVQEEQKKDAEAMSHSVQQQKDYIKK